VYIKHFLAALGHAGLNNMLAGFVDPASGRPDTRAWALCTFAYSAGPGNEPILFEGRTDGHIVPARGPGTFGWDCAFEPVEGGGKTYSADSTARLAETLTLGVRYAEMEPEAKNKISHRYRALEKLRAHIQSLPK
jgi:inosine triphosphate pyrophosphatase